MIYSLHGTVIHKEPGLAVIECGGVGYACQVSLRTLGALPEVGKETFLYTYMGIREDAVELCGFSDENELSCFRMLLSVSGVGLRVALGILSSLTPERFAVCVASGDDKSLRKCGGVGPKLASRIILELKDRLAKSGVAAVDTVGVSEAASGAGNLAEAVNALEVLGYARADAASALAGADPGAKVEDLIKQGLKKLASRL